MEGTLGFWIGIAVLLFAGGMLLRTTRGSKKRGPTKLDLH